MRKTPLTILAIVAGALLAAIALAPAQTTPVFETSPPPSLKTVPVPEPPNLYDFVADKAAAIRLGKALFWDMQVGSDGVVACATCHFHAGADSRSVNQLHPGIPAVPATATSPGEPPRFSLSSATLVTPRFRP